MSRTITPADLVEIAGVSRAKVSCLLKGLPFTLRGTKGRAVHVYEVEVVCRSLALEKLDYSGVIARLRALPIKED